jgi:molybdate transport system substrate-binding protein
MGDPTHVPAGIYGKAALERLGLWQGVAHRIARADNVRAALMLVAEGEAPLGIVYETDARAESRVRIVAVFPESSHGPILYPAAVLAESADPEAAGRLLAFLTSVEARAIFERFGFSPAM